MQQADRSIDPRAFSRHFKELVADREGNQMDVAVKLGYKQSRISQVSRGERPSREFVERLVEAYDLPREEWLSLAGYGPGSAPEDERLSIATAAATQALRDYVQGQRALRWFRETQELVERYDAGLLSDEIRHVDLGSDEGVDRAVEALRARVCPREGACP